MLDEMAIRKHMKDWDGEKFRGYVDIGTGVVDDSLSEAKDALVFMVVCINGSWKVPYGYFLIDGLSSAEKANLITSCLEKLYDVGVKVASITCDGPASHFAMLRTLGANLDVGSLDPSFQHPCDHSAKVHVLLDVCHMLKLVRNTFADAGILYDEVGNAIRWKYLSDLPTLQEEEGLRLANKLKSSHRCWQKQKVKVNVAAQSLSSSVADALDYCNVKLKLSRNFRFLKQHPNSYGFLIDCSTSVTQETLLRRTSRRLCGKLTKHMLMHFWMRHFPTSSA